MTFRVPTSSEGDFKVNDNLDVDSRSIWPFLNGPESLIIHNDIAYAATADGIYKVKMKTKKRGDQFASGCLCICYIRMLLLLSV